MEADKEAMIQSFEITTRCLMERLKDLETPNFEERPTTAQVFGRIHDDDPRDKQGVPGTTVMTLEPDGSSTVEEKKTESS